MARVIRIDRELPRTWKDALAEFLEFKQAQGLSPVTANDYTKHVTQFFTRYPDAHAPGKLRDCILEYMSQPVAPATFNLRRAYLKSFFNWCVQEGILAQNPLTGIPKRLDEGRARSIAEDTLRKLLSLPNRGSFAGLRDYALMILSLDTGIRPGEALGLLPADIDLTNCTVTVRRHIAKTGRTRVLPMSRETAKALKMLLGARHPAWPKSAPVFCTQDGTPLRLHSWEDRLQEYSEALNTRITPYDLRHTFALLFLRQGANAFSLQRMLGHTSMEMTRRYVNLTGEDMQSQHALASPVNRLIPSRKRVGSLKPRTE